MCGHYPNEGRKVSHYTNHHQWMNGYHACMWVRRQWLKNGNLSPSTHDSNSIFTFTEHYAEYGDVQLQGGGKVLAAKLSRHNNV